MTREASALAAIRGHQVPAPQLLAMDAHGTETGVRCTLTSALTGQPDLTPADIASWVGQLATTQAAIHAVPDHPQTRWDRWCGDGAPTSSPDQYGVHDRPLDRRADLRALLCFDLDRQCFIPQQVASRVPLDLTGMPGRVAAAVRGALDGID